MAEKENNDNWLGSWLTAAKEKIKNSEVLEYVKKDLEEFGNVIKNEASNVMSSTSTAIGKTLKFENPPLSANSMKQSFSAFLDQMNTALSPSPDDSDTEAIMVVEGSETVTLSKLQKAIYELQSNEKTFLCDPDTSLQKQFICWLDIIEDQLVPEQTKKHLKKSNMLKSQFDALVPEKVAEDVFWKRYLFKKALIEDDYAREEISKKKEVDNQVSQEIQWNQEDFVTDIELTEEEQIRLLEEYENETKQRNNSPKMTGKLSNDSSSGVELSKTTSTATNSNSQISDSDRSKSLNNSSSHSSIDEDWEKITDLEKC